MPLCCERGPHVRDGGAQVVDRGLETGEVVGVPIHVAPEFVDVAGEVDGDFRDVAVAITRERA